MAHVALCRFHQDALQLLDLHLAIERRRAAGRALLHGVPQPAFPRAPRSFVVTDCPRLKERVLGPIPLVETWSPTYIGTWTCRACMYIDRKVRTW